MTCGVYNFIMRRSFVTLLVLILFFGLLEVLLPKTITIPLPSISTPSPSITQSASSSAQLVKVKRVIDGDTIELETGQKVRYTGMNTPEIHNPKTLVQCFGMEAKYKNQELVEGKTVRLEKDVSETDKYKRLLRYVYLPSSKAGVNDIFINDYLVKEGYAVIDTFPPDVKYVDLFLKSQREAREQNKGLWKACAK